MLAFSSAVRAAVFIAGLAAASASAGLAQPYSDPDESYAPAYEVWQSAWDRFEFDRHHVVLGTVMNFAPYRLRIQRHDGDVETIDLRHGTVIRPEGATPEPGQRVAVVGYWSKGTFIADRLVLRY